jgi:hypothetical protein
MSRVLSAVNTLLSQKGMIRRRGGKAKKSVKNCTGIATECSEMILPEHQDPFWT